MLSMRAVLNSDERRLMPWDFVSFAEQEGGQIGAVLTGDFL